MGRKPKARRDAYGAWLYHLRKERKLTQQELAKLVGVPQTTLGYWETDGEIIRARNYHASGKIT